MVQSCAYEYAWILDISWTVYMILRDISLSIYHSHTPSTTERKLISHVCLTGGVITLQDYCLYCVATHSCCFVNKHVICNLNHIFSRRLLKEDNVFWVNVFIFKVSMCVYFVSAACSVNFLKDLKMQGVSRFVLFTRV